MKKILVIGGGAMGSAFTIPCLENNNDVVTSVPLFLMGYKHHGDLTYINYFGYIRKMSLWQIVKDKWRGRWRAFRKGQPFDGAYDHGMAYYVKYTDPMYAEGINK